MTKILGLDLGTNSIGWAVVDDEKNEILGMGSRIFPEGVVARTIGKGEKEESKNASRRNSRQQRRQYYRKRLRKIKLLKTLKEFEMCPIAVSELDEWSKWEKSKGKEGRKSPNSEEYQNWIKQNPYLLRNKALSEPLTLMELGRVFYHLIQRRGFLSSRKGKLKDEGSMAKGDAKKGIVGYDDTIDEIKNTLGTFLFSILPKEKDPFKLITDENGNQLRVRSRYTLRDMYVEEFDKIWKFQAENLRLGNKIAKKEWNVFLKGSLEKNKRNKYRIESLKNKYGEENIDIKNITEKNKEGNLYKVKITKNVSLKEFLGGKIEYDEEGVINHKSKESVLFWQRPLRSQKGLLTKCRFEPDLKKGKKHIQRGKTPCFLSHPLFEEFRAYKFINNIKFGKNLKQRLDKNQRKVVLDLINKKDKNFNFSDIPKTLKIHHETWNFDNDYKVTGNYTTKHLSNLFSKEIWEAKKTEIWHCFKDFEDVKNLTKKLTESYGLKEKDKAEIEKINLKEGYSNISLKAIKNILPFLYEGYYESHAIVLGGVFNTFENQIAYFKDSILEIKKGVLDILKENNKEGEVIEKIKNFLIDNKYGFVKNDKRFRKLYHPSQEVKKKKIEEKIDKIENLRNPIVQQGISETKRVVNVLIDKFGKFDRVQVELGRDLKNGKKKRNELGFKINENNKKNEEARRLLSEFGLQNSRLNVQKSLLYKEMQHRGSTVCPYTNIPINIKDVLGNENKIQVEHIVPRSISLNDSFANKTLCESKFNSLKGNLTPYQFYLKNSDSKLWGGATTWDEVSFRAFKLLPFHKAKIFTSKKCMEKIGFIERQLNDTRYISKKVTEIMSQICEDVRVLPGKLTSEIRHLWGLNNLLQPILDLDIDIPNIEQHKRYRYYVVLDENQTAIETKSVFNTKPKLKNNQTTVVGKISDKGVFSFDKLKFSTENLSAGEYWAKLDLSNPKEIRAIFKEKPFSAENEIILRGNVKKNKFSSKSVTFTSDEKLDDGYYWVKFPIVKKKFVLPEKNKTPKKTNNQILLYGNVKNNLFSSYIYECETESEDGNYWVLFDVDVKNSEFEKSVNERPKINENQLLVEGTVNNEEVFVSETDSEHSFQKKGLKHGKYWVVFDVLNEPSRYQLIKNESPKVEKNLKVVEGAVWVDEYGEMKFDPQKNRDDHRHHAVDALVIALSKQSFYQRLSTANAQKERKRKKMSYDKEQMKFPEPWDNFYNDAKEKVENILISHKQNKKILTVVKKKIYKNGKTHVSEGFSVRGQLHKENVYGKRKSPNQDNYSYHRRKEVSELKINQLDKIVDPVIRKIIKIGKEKESEINEKIKLLEKKNNSVEQDKFIIDDQIELLKKEISKLYTLKNKNGEPVPIKKVRVKEVIGGAEKLKESTNQYVNPRNNHHILIYKDVNNELKEQVVAFWTAVERKKQKQNIVQLPEDGKEIVATLQKNDMFLLGLNEDEINWDNPNYSLLKNHLFRVQKFTSGDYYFRKHQASVTSNIEEKQQINSFGEGKNGWKTHNPIKVKINHTGEIIKSY